jgi:hypothetical protein
MASNGNMAPTTNVDKKKNLNPASYVALPNWKFKPWIEITMGNNFHISQGCNLYHMTLMRQEFPKVKFPLVVVGHVDVVLGQGELFGIFLMGCTVRQGLQQALQECQSRE